jgi:hypothetical protein
VIRRLWALTVWHPRAFPLLTSQLEQDLRRWVLPGIDIALIIGSAFGIHGGLPTLTVVYSQVVAEVASFAALVFSIGCLIGVSFPRLMALELAAKCGLAFVLILYALLLLGLAAGEYPGRGFIAGVCAALSVVLAWRIVWIGRDYRKRALMREASGG